MNFEPDPGEQRFRAEVRAFVTRAVAETFPDRARGGGIPAYTRADVRAWTQALHRHGWSVPHWPVEWGGIGWPPLWRAIFEDEINGVQCPPRDMISIGFIGPVLYTFGTEAQKQRFLPRIRSGEDAWCQGFSEPDAGSDVMALRTSAIRQGDQFVVNGRKLWITNAHHADMMFALARIDAPGNRRQQGLSFLLVDMRTPGIRVTPVITIDGAHRLNEVTLDNVRVPIENLVGEQGKGWVYARFLLDKERSLVAQLPALRRLIATLRQTLTTERRCGTPLIDEASWRLKLAQFDVELGALSSSSCAISTPVKATLASPRSPRCSNCAAPNCASASARRCGTRSAIAAWSSRSTRRPHQTGARTGQPRTICSNARRRWPVGRARFSATSSPACRWDSRRRGGLRTLTRADAAAGRGSRVLPGPLRLPGAHGEPARRRGLQPRALGRVRRTGLARRGDARSARRDRRLGDRAGAMNRPVAAIAASVPPGTSRPAAGPGVNVLDLLRGLLLARVVLDEQPRDGGAQRRLSRLERQPDLGARFVFLPGARQLEDAVGGVPELRQRRSPGLRLSGRPASQRHLFLLLQRVVQIEADAVELRGPGDEGIAFARVEHVPHGERELIQIVLDAEKLK